MCGEKGGKNHEIRHHLGSPPRVRGKGIRKRRQQHILGITPACAGKSRAPIGVQVPVQDPPPRVRGKVTVGWVPFSLFRITPACAGKRGPTGAGRAPARDHPRVCGEKVTGTDADDADVGSPPRVRGKVAIYE